MKRTKLPSAEDLLGVSMVPATPRSMHPALLVVLGALTFNAILALANANGVRMTSATVIGAEVLITGLAVGIIVSRWVPAMMPWALLLGFIVLQSLLFSLVKGGFDPKFLRDAAAIPIFIMLGMTAPRVSLVRFLIVTQTIVVLVMLFEGAAPELFGRVFNVTSYYVNTRGFTEDSFWMKDTGLFVSSFRPGERFFFNSWNLHRLSSVFLEPVSLGNYLVIVFAALMALRTEFSRPALVYMLVTCAMILVGCDGRQATVQCILVVAIALGWRVLPRPVTALILPVAVLFAFAAVLGLGLKNDGDNFTGRLVYSVDTIRRFELEHFLGIFAGNIAYTYDSGIAYFIATQSLIGVAAIWFAIVFLGEAEDESSRIFLNSACMYFALSLLVSNAAFSVKTGALLWFTLGYLTRRAGVRAAEGHSAERARQLALASGGASMVASR
jgi:putative polymerase